MTQQASKVIPLGTFVVTGEVGKEVLDLTAHFHKDTPPEVIVSICALAMTAIRKVALEAGAKAGFSAEHINASISLTNEQAGGAS